MAWMGWGLTRKVGNVGTSHVTSVVVALPTLPSIVYLAVCLLLATLLHRLTKEKSAGHPRVDALPGSVMTNVVIH